MLSERLVCDNVHANFVLLRELVKLLGYLSVDAEDTGPESPQFCTRDNPRENRYGNCNQAHSHVGFTGPRRGTARINYRRPNQRPKAKIWVLDERNDKWERASWRKTIGDCCSASCSMLRE